MNTFEVYRLIRIFLSSTTTSLTLVLCSCGRDGISTNERLDCVRSEQLKRQDSLYYFQGELLNGCIEDYVDGKLFFWAEAKQGKLNGKSRRFLSDGVYIDGTFIDNRLTGELRTYFPDGKIMREERCDENGLTGESREYYRSGELKVLLHYKNDKRNGKYKKYYETGELWEVGNYKDDNLVDSLITYFQNGRLQHVGLFNNGLAEGLNISFADSLHLDFMWGYMKNGESLGRWYYKLSVDSCFYRDYKTIDDYVNTPCNCKDLPLPPVSRIVHR